MAAGSFDDHVVAAPSEFIFLISAELVADAHVWVPASSVPTIDGRPITALAPDPDFDDLVYVTTHHPDALMFLPDPCLEVDDL